MVFNTAMNDTTTTIKTAADLAEGDIIFPQFHPAGVHVAKVTGSGNLTTIHFSDGTYTPPVSATFKVKVHGNAKEA